MLAVVLFVAVISAFSFFAAFKLNRTFEETMPISAMAIILFLFFTGMINILGVGWILVCIGAVALYGYTFYWIVKQVSVGNALMHKHMKASIKNSAWFFITPGFAIFTILAVMIAHFNQGRLAFHTDEFSHWLDTVVIMTRIDAFGTAEGSGAIFPSYPPAMSLFQYLMEKINMVTTGDFSEWKVYFAYQILAVTIMLPFVKIKGKTIVQKAVSIISWPICLFVPLQFFKDMYSSLYIDPFLGVLGGCGFAAISVTKKKDWLYTTYITLLTATLVLSKDVGIYLAIFMGIYYIIDYLSREGFSKKNVAMSLLPVASMMVAKMLWKLELSVSHTVQKFSQPFDIKGTIDTIKGNGNEFYNTVYENFQGALTYRYIFYERLGFNYSAMMFILVVALICFHVNLCKKQQLKKGAAVAGAVIPAVAIIFYILSMFPLYISRFAEEEALNLASFDRYCGIMFLTGLLLVFWLGRDILVDADGKVIPVAIAIGMLLSVRHSKKDEIYEYTSRASVEESLARRHGVDQLAFKINQECEEDATILVVYSEGEDLVQAMLSTITKPRTIDTSVDYFPSSTPEDTSTLLSQENLLTVISAKYDYVAVYTANECLTTNYSDMFEEGQPENGSLYKYNSETGKMVLVR